MTGVPQVDCAGARSGLWPPERPRLDGDAERRAREHVHHCPECVRYFAQDRQLLDALDELRARKAPRHVREGVLDTLARARLGAPDSGPLVIAAPARRRWGRSTALATAGSIVTLGALAWGWAGTARASAGVASAALTDDYVRRAVAEDHLMTDDPREVARFVTRELGVQAGPIRRPDLEIEGVEICLIEGRRGAMIVYRLDGRRISHYLIPRPAGPARPPAPAGSAPTGGEATIPVVSWAVGVVEHALVGEFPPGTLLELARAGNEIAR